MSWDETARASSLAKRRQLAVAKAALKTGGAELLVADDNSFAVVGSDGTQLFVSGPDARILMRLERFAAAGQAAKSAFEVASQGGGWYVVTNKATGEAVRVQGKAKVEALIG